MKILSKITVNRAKEIAQKLNANAVIVEKTIGSKHQQMAVSEEAWKNRPYSNDHYEVVGTIDSTGAIL